MTATIHYVKQFHEKFGHLVAGSPDPGTKELRELRVRLIAGELLELCKALGVSLEMSYHPHEGDQEIEDDSTIEINAIAEDWDVDIVGTADALGDLDYVVAGANLVFGIPAQAVMEEIQASNMSKLGADGNPIVREDGKILKGPNYFKPNIRLIILNGVRPPNMGDMVGTGSLTKIPDYSHEFDPDAKGFCKVCGHTPHTKAEA